jgi:hypothetical protein
MGSSFSVKSVKSLSSIARRRRTWLSPFFIQTSVQKPGENRRDLVRFSEKNNATARQAGKMACGAKRV